MADVLPDDPVAALFHVLLDRVGDVADAAARAGKFYPLEEALPGDLDEALGLLRRLTCNVGPGAVAHIALIGGSHVHGNDIALLQDALAGDAMDNFLIHREADAGGIAAVPQKGGDGAALLDEAAHFPIDLSSRDAGGYHFPCQRTGSRGNSSRLTHDLDLPRGFDNDSAHIPSAFSISAVVASMVGWLATVLSFPRSL